MTVGQRIAHKRKELGLSQEVLGGQMGVSRQAIYKWESDAALPEIDKLITLSRVFHVSVGWLLGEESAPSAPSAPSDGDLSENQLRMVEEIVNRYLAAQPSAAVSEPEAPPPSQPPRRKRRILAAVLATGAVFLVFANLFSRLDALDGRYQNLQNSIASVSSNVNNQISSITSRVEQILHSQNALTAEWTTDILNTDLAANTVTFSARAVPKTYREGMTAHLVARSGDEVTQAPAQIGPGNTFEGEIICPLTDRIELSIIFVSEGQEQTQLLNEWHYLYSSSFPYVFFLGGPLWFDHNEKRPDILSPGDVQLEIETQVKGGHAPVTDIKVGLFRDKELLFWYEEEWKNVFVNGTPTQQLHYVRSKEVTLEQDRTYTQAAVVTDEYGRTKIYPGDSLVYEHGQWSHSGVTISQSADTSGWTF